MTIPFEPIVFWSTLSSKVMKKFLAPHCAGTFSEEEAELKNAHLIIGKQGHKLMGNSLTFYWLVDKQNGIILDAKFQYFGHPYLIPLAETTCNLVAGKSYSEAYKLTVDDIDRSLRTQIQEPALPKDSLSLYHFVIDALDAAVEQCLEIPLEDGSFPLEEASFSPNFEDADPYNQSDWDALTHEQKLYALRNTIEQKIGPYIAMDGGQVTVESLEDLVVTIAYSGNCSACPSSLGSTLNSIGQLLRAYIYPELQVKVNESSLDLSNPHYPPGSPLTD
ncbi:Fe-S cluster assembly protein NifU,NifU-like N terminal domain [Chlamydia serpentis]|uniref:Nitrogen fixation protein NifU n=1 Tax=Chlamydia serpentis TaxID=1967782 RepID=A0A2R8FC41_9CHLA|nr:iron-sulfur cluster assembly scaffold protein [Chlamydia serpentis]SPN73973.1 Fe-S cluster assembly protein NifU,NifU-like N terminal domain [Chlamydia serpentis]